MFSPRIVKFPHHQRPLLATGTDSGEEGEVLVGRPLGVEFEGVEVVHPLLAALFRIPIKSFVGSVVELPGN